MKLGRCMCLFCSMKGDISGYRFQVVSLIPFRDCFLYNLSVMTHRTDHAMQTIKPNISALRMDTHLVCHLVQGAITIIQDYIHIVECPGHAYITAGPEHLYIEIRRDLNAKGYRNDLMRA